TCSGSSCGHPTMSTTPDTSSQSRLSMSHARNKPRDQSIAYPVFAQCIAFCVESSWSEETAVSHVATATRGSFVRAEPHARSGCHIGHGLKHSWDRRDVTRANFANSCWSNLPAAQ